MSNRDSLVYWLEFKNDDEFLSIFGSIAGGSSSKYTIFNRNETGEWEKRTDENANKTIPITQEEAIEIARDNRDKLITGFNLLNQMPENPTVEDYLQLQTQMDELLPVISNLGWGHKYFSLFFPNLLDDYHVNYLQKFFIRKMLHIPPDSEGRYLPAWWFIQAKNELRVPINHLTTVLNHMYGTSYKYWRIGTTSGDTGQSFWDDMRLGDYVAIGWDQLGDLSHFSKGMDVEKHFIETMDYTTKNVITRKAREVRRFTNVTNYPYFLDINDIVVAMEGQTVLGIGQIAGSYYFAEGESHAHRRPVKWLSIEEWKIPQSEGLRTTCYRFKKYEENLIEIERHVLYAQKLVDEADKSSKSLPEKPRKLPELDSKIKQIKRVLERKKQVILYGPPGTGKTYWARNTAYELSARNNFGKALESISGDERNHVEYYVRMCSFHPAYGYEDFLEGYRPEVVSGEMVFSKRDGIFKQLCRDAFAEPNLDFYLIIDEINRGDIPRIFGELITLLEGDKRGQMITLPLSGEEFSVPSNIFLIGTMNTADRSIALLDTALRRRFGFIELMPDISMLANSKVEGIPLDLWLRALNDRIVKFVGRDARNLQIGHAYLMIDGKAVTEFTQFSQIVNEDIIPLIEEYCYEDYDTLEKILGKGLVDRKRQLINYELFDINQQGNLIQALLETSPEITTSTRALSEEPDEEIIEDIEDDDELEGESEKGE